MLPTLIQKYDKKIISFLSQFKNPRPTRLSDATFYDCINTLYQFIKPFLDKNVFFWGIWSLKCLKTARLVANRVHPD